MKAVETSSDQKSLTLSEILSQSHCWSESLLPKGTVDPALRGFRQAQFQIRTFRERGFGPFAAASGNQFARAHQACGRWTRCGRDIPHTKSVSPRASSAKTI